MNRPLTVRARPSFKSSDDFSSAEYSGGYVWWTVPFAFAAAAMVRKRLNDLGFGPRRYAVVMGFSIGNLFAACGLSEFWDGAVSGAGIQSKTPR